MDLISILELIWDTYKYNILHAWWRKIQIKDFAYIDMQKRSRDT